MSSEINFTVSILSNINSWEEKEISLTFQCFGFPFPMAKAPSEATYTFINSLKCPAKDVVSVTLGHCANGGSERLSNLPGAAQPRAGKAGKV